MRSIPAIGCEKRHVVSEKKRTFFDLWSQNKRKLLYERDEQVLFWRVGFIAACNLLAFASYSFP